MTERMDYLECKVNYTTRRQVYYYDCNFFFPSTPEHFIATTLFDCKAN